MGDVVILVIRFKVDFNILEVPFVAVVGDFLEGSETKQDLLLQMILPALVFTTYLRVI